MSNWTALNVEYQTDSWTVPELDHLRVNAFTQDEHGGEFDLLLDVFQRGNRDFVANKLRDIAIWNGTPQEMVLVEGSDTSDLFTFKRVEVGGVTMETWSNRPHTHRSPEESVLEAVAAEVGLRPSWGGNYRGYEE